MNQLATGHEIAPVRTLLDPQRTVEHRMRRGWFEKRIVRTENTRFVLYRFLTLYHARRLAWMLETAPELPLQRHLHHVAGWRDAVRCGGY